MSDISEADRANRHVSVRTKFFYGSGAAAEAAIGIVFNTFNFC